MRTDSPIEAMLLEALLALLDDEYSDHPQVEITINTQAKVGPYRVDILMRLLDHERHLEANLIVECDGHEWHERTKEQAQRDRARDRAILCAGYPTIRFTGSEIFRDPALCAYDSFAALLALGQPKQVAIGSSVVAG